MRTHTFGVETWVQHHSVRLRIRPDAGGRILDAVAEVRRRLGIGRRVWLMCYCDIGQAPRPRKSREGSSMDRPVFKSTASPPGWRFVRAEGKKTEMTAFCHRLCGGQRVERCRVCPNAAPPSLRHASGEKTRALLFPFSIESLATLPVTPCRLRHAPSSPSWPNCFPILLLWYYQLFHHHKNL